MLSVLHASSRGSNPQGIPPEAQDAVARLSQAYLDSLVDDIYKKIEYSIFPSELFAGMKDPANLTPGELHQLTLHFERLASRYEV